ncbi:MAG: diguanylate cyclase [Desulfobacterales bacterium]|nr:diguanylate cyclase [Desulfobacterales bacterium]
MIKASMDSILIVDNNIENTGPLKKLLDINGFRPVVVKNGIQAIEYLKKENSISLILSDITIPQMNGYELCGWLKKEPETKIIPVIFLTEKCETPDIVKGFEAGASDYITKPFSDEELLARIKTHILFKKAVQQEQEKKRRIKERSLRDGLTGLYNRYYLNDFFEQEFKRTQRYEADLSCLLLDLDFFKEINDTHGHPFGDFVLKAFAGFLKENIRLHDMAFRYGGEEFLIILPQTNIKGAQVVAEKIRTRCETNKISDGKDKVSLTVSIGLVSKRYHSPDCWENLVGLADKALYKAKSGGRNRVVIYNDDTINTPIDEDTKINILKDRLSHALEKTKVASLESLSLLVRDHGGALFQRHNQLVHLCIEQICSKLQLPPNITEIFKRSSSLENCFKVLLKGIMVNRSKELTGKERDAIKNYPYMLVELTSMFDFFSDERSVLLYHHERYDGTGYPERLKGEQIPIGARIFFMVDSFIAMLSDRPYRKRLTDENVVKELADNAGTQFDPMLVLVFLDIITENELICVSEEILSEAKSKVSRAIKKLSR